METGLCTISNMDAPVEEVLAVAAETGYDCVEVWGRDHVGDGSAETCERIADRAADLGLEVAVYGSYLAPGTDGFAAAVESELAVAERLGADLIRVWPGESEYGECSADEWDAAVADLSAVAERAAARGVGVTVEKHKGRLTDAGEGARRLIEDVDHPNCGLNWQPLFGIPAADLLAEAETLAPLSNNVHIQAKPAPDATDRCLLADAYFDVGAILERFDAAGFDGAVEVEFVTPDLDYETAVRRDYEFLRTVSR